MCEKLKIKGIEIMEMLWSNGGQEKLGYKRRQANGKGQKPSPVSSPLITMYVLWYILRNHVTTTCFVDGSKDDLVTRINEHGNIIGYDVVVENMRFPQQIIKTGRIPDPKEQFAEDTEHDCIRRWCVCVFTPKIWLVCICLLCVLLITRLLRLVGRLGSRKPV